MNKKDTGSHPGSQDNHSPTGTDLDPFAANSEIGKRLKRFYDDIVSDDVPDRFAELLGRLEAADATRKRD